MSLLTEIEKLESWMEQLPKVGMATIGGPGSPMWVLDFIMLGVVKRSLGLAGGVITLIKTENMLCARALVRMQLDTVSRLLAYTYVTDPEALAMEVFKGKPLNKFKCKDGKELRDGYLIERMSQEYPWVKDVYKYTSGYVHFSERQVFDSVATVGSDEERTVTFQIHKADDKFPEESWIEVVACFTELLEIVAKLLTTYAKEKAARRNSIQGA